jgi:hypothetical protein
VLLRASANYFELEDSRQDDGQDRIPPVGPATISCAAVIAVVVAFVETLAKVVVVVALFDITPRKTVVRVAIGKGILVVVSPAILPIRLAATKPFLIAVVDGLSEQVRAILVRLTVVSAQVVTVAPGRVEEWVTTVVVIAVALNLQLLLLKRRRVLLLNQRLRPAILPLELCGLRLRTTQLLIQVPLIERRALLLLRDALLLLLL